MNTSSSVGLPTVIERISSGKCLDQPRHPFVSLRHLQPHSTVNDCRIHQEALAMIANSRAGHPSRSRWRRRRPFAGGYRACQKPPIVRDRESQFDQPRPLPPINESSARPLRCRCPRPISDISTCRYGPPGRVRCWVRRAITIAAVQHSLGEFDAAPQPAGQGFNRSRAVASPKRAAYPAAARSSSPRQPVQVPCWRMFSATVSF